MKALVRTVLIMLIAAAGVLPLTAAQPARAQGTQDGCAVLNGYTPNNPTYGDYWSGTFTFKAGDTITITADFPDGGNQPSFATLAELFLEGNLVASTPVPGTITYTFSTDTTLTGDPAIEFFSSTETLLNWTVDCSGAAATSGGCETLVNIPPTAVGGTFVTDAQLYWEPGQLTAPIVTLKAGDSVRVLGFDASQQFYEIIWQCKDLWVLSSTLGPTYDSVWQGRPLPTGVTGGPGSGRFEGGPGSGSFEGGPGSGRFEGGPGSGSFEGGPGSGSFE